MGKSNLRACFSNTVDCYWKQSVFLSSLNTQESFCSFWHSGKPVASKNQNNFLPPWLALHGINQPDQHLLQPHKSLDGHGQLNSTFTTKPTRSFARVRASPPAARLCCDTGPLINVANWRPCMVPARIPTLLLGGAKAKSLQFCGVKHALDPDCSTTLSHTCQGGSSPAHISWDSILSL